MAAAIIASAINPCIASPSFANVQAYPDIMPASPYPNVPVTPGVPPVPRDASNSTSGDESRLTKDAGAIDRLAATQWGIFENGRPVLRPDNIVAIGYSSESRIADYQIEEGKFENYNKVAMPYQGRVTMTKGGTLSERQDFLYQIESIRGNLRIYDIVTPERAYISCNIERVVLDRTASNGAGLLTVEVVLREIRQTATTAFSSSKTPAGTSEVNGGSVQTKPSTVPPEPIK